MSRRDKLLAALELVHEWHDKHYKLGQSSVHFVSWLIVEVYMTTPLLNKLITNARKARTR